MNHLRDTHTKITDAEEHLPTNNIMESFAEALNRRHEQLKRELANAHLEVAEYGRRNVAKEFKVKNPNVSITTHFVNPDIQRYFLAQSGRRVKGIDETTLKELQNQLYVAYTLKETPAQWEARIKSVLNCSKPKGRAEMIARTELAWAYSKGVSATYHELGKNRVRWLAVMDARTCRYCSELHDTELSLMEAESMLPRHPRCRCTIVSVD